jgi:hypothetical protein
MAFPRSGTVDTQTFSGTKDFIFAHVSALVNSNIGAADHIQFNTVDFSRPVVGASDPSGAQQGTAITLDTTTNYTNTSGVASIGRFTVRGGKLYKLECSPGYVLFSGATGLLSLQWFDVTTGSGVALGQPQSIYAMTDASNDGASGDLWTMYNPGGGQNDLFLLEVQITVATALTSIGNTAKGLPTVLVETY